MKLGELLAKSEYEVVSGSLDREISDISISGLPFTTSYSDFASSSLSFI